MIALGCNNPPPSNSQDPTTQWVGTNAVEEDIAYSSPQTTEANYQNAVLSLITNRCAIPDPAVDAWNSQEGLIKPSLVPEIHSGLMVYTDDVQMPVEFALASSYSYNDSEHVYKFELKLELTFSNGTPLTASDVKWSWERALRMSTGTGRANDVLGHIQGADSVVNNETHELSGLEVVDERVIKIRLNEPRSDFVTMLADPVASVLNRDNVKLWDGTWSNFKDHFTNPDAELSDEQLLVGAGPFKLTRYRTGRASSECSLERNEHYWAEPAKLDAILLSDRPFQGVALAKDIYSKTDTLFAASQIDINPFAPNNHQLLSIYDPVDTPKIFESNTPISSLFIALNTDYPPFDDIRTRRALIGATAQVRESTINGLSPALRILPPSLHQNVPIIVPTPGQNDITASIPSEYTEAPPDLNLAVFNHEPYFFEQEVNAVLNNWREQLELIVFHNILSPEEFFAKLSKGDIPARVIDFALSTPLISAQYTPIADAFGREDPPKHYETLQAMLDDAVSEHDDVARSNKFAEVETYILENALVVPVIWNEALQTTLLQPWVHDLRNAPFPRSLFKDVWLDQRAPARTLH